MRFHRLNYRNLSIWIILVLQILLITSYFIIPESQPRPQSPKVSFIKYKTNSVLNRPELYHTIDDSIQLPQRNSSDFYTDFNTSLCYKPGSDLKGMKRSKIANWRCECLPGWHGSDCSQPEIIWRTLLRKPVLITGPRKHPRRIIYLFPVDKFSLIATEMRINELHYTIDLFVLFDLDGFLQEKLDRNYLKVFHKVILYIRALNANDAWRKTQKVIGNLHEDDVVLIGGNYNEIPHVNALNFIKLYDKWPQPLVFRYRWSVYGYYWLHPNKTVQRGGASTISFLKQVLGGNLDRLYANNVKGLLIGDLNHFGGWFCDLCLESVNLLDYLIHIKDVRVLEKSIKIDVAYLEELIENGVYVDGKTELLRTHRFHERDFAPSNISIAYDWLLINLYSKIDY